MKKANKQARVNEEMKKKLTTESYNKYVKYLSGLAAKPIKKSGSGTLGAFNSALLKNQESLGQDFESVLNENIDTLYEDK